jgi:hypothetical protein
MSLGWLYPALSRGLLERLKKTERPGYDQECRIANSQALYPESRSETESEIFMLNNAAILWVTYLLAFPVRDQVDWNYITD